jgi:hypothetical protein
MSGGADVHRRFGFWAAVLMLAGLGPAVAGPRATTDEELVLTVQVSSAEHEAIEGYFSLGDSTTIMVKPGTDLHRFLIRQRGKRLKVTLRPDERPEVSRLSRDK